MLGRVIGQHWLPLVRDVLALGYRAEDILTTLSVAEMAAIVCAAPPTSSVALAINGGWTKEAHMLANMQEQNAGLAELPRPYERPGVEKREEEGLLTRDGKLNMFGGKKLQELTWEQAEERDRQRRATALAAEKRGVKPTYQGGDTKVRTI